MAVQAGCGSGFNAIFALAPGLVSDFHLTRQVAEPLLTAPPYPQRYQGITLEALLHAWTTRTPSSPLYTSDGHIDDCEHKNTLNVAEFDMAESELGSSFIPALHKPSALLPIAKHRQSLLYLVETRQVTIVVGQTGSGKTTQIPQFLEKAGWCANGKVIAVTQVGPCPSLLPDSSH